MKKVIVLLIMMLFMGACKSSEQQLTPIENDAPKESVSLDLLGDEQMTLEFNQEYVEPGYNTADEYQDDVKIQGEVKKIPGEYTLTYTLETENGTISKERKVKVLEYDGENASFVPVLMYHYFYDDEANETGVDGNYLAKTDFIKQLEYLKENNYYYPTMSELKKYLDGEIKLPPKSIILTMDDGAESNYRIAYPLAVSYKIPIVWFVVTSWTNPNLPYQQEIINSGYVSMESHTHDMHKAGCSGMGHGGYFQCVSKEEGINDLTTSKEMLKTAISLAYPFGDYNDSTKEMLKEAGYDLAFTTEWGVVRPGMDQYALPRIRISAGNSLQTFIESIS